MNNDYTTMDLQIGTAETDVSASGFWSDNYAERPDTIRRVPRFALIAEVVLTIATSPVTAVPDFWFLERRRRDVSTLARSLEGVIGRPISRSEALQIALHILERAERERIQLAEWEAERGIQWEDGG